MRKPGTCACAILPLLLLQPLIHGYPQQRCDPQTQYWDDGTERCDLCTKLCFPGQGSSNRCRLKCPNFQPRAATASTPESKSSTTSQATPPIDDAVKVPALVSVGVVLGVVAVAGLVALLYRRRLHIRSWFKSLCIDRLAPSHHAVSEEQRGQGPGELHTGTQTTLHGPISQEAAPMLNCHGAG